VPRPLVQSPPRNPGAVAGQVPLALGGHPGA
jgi:hypothetical protein